MIRSFRDRGTEDVFDRRDTKAARKQCPQALWAVAHRKLDQVNAAARLDDLRTPPGNRLERLEDDRAGQWAIRVSSQYRVCFVWAGGDAHDVELTDYH
ncbi:MAG: type II toxin-antitoxin system RelE/ParE family toxin [Gemmatimonadaceae bacterium]